MAANLKHHIINSLMGMSLITAIGWSAQGQMKKIVITGSSSLSPMFHSLGAEFGPAHHVGISVETRGSKDGVKCVLQNKCDIGLSSSSVKPEDVPNAEIHHLGWDSAVVAIDEKANVKALTSQQIKEIYSGKYTNWKDLGGANLPIVLYHRSKSHALREIFDKFFKLDEKSTASELGNNEEVLNRLKFGPPGGIAYMSFGFAKVKDTKGLNLASLDGVEPTIENIKSGKYKLKKELVFLVDKAKTSDPTIKEFVAFVMKNRVEFVNKFEFVAD